MQACLFYTDLIIFAGVPATTVSAGTSSVTTATAATTEFSPMVISGRMMAPAPNGQPPKCTQFR